MQKKKKKRVETWDKSQLLHKLLYKRSFQALLSESIQIRAEKGIFRPSIGFKTKIRDKRSWIQEVSQKSQNLTSLLSWTYYVDEKLDNDDGEFRIFPFPCFKA